LDYGEKKLISPYLITGGITFLALAGILIHDGIMAFFSISINYIESIVGVVCFYIGFLSLFIILILLAIVFKNRKNDIIGALVLIGLYLGYESIIRFLPIIETIDLWLDVIIIISYGLIRGLATTFTNRSLKYPVPGYRNIALDVYGWSFLVTSILSIIFTLIALATLSIGLLNFALIILIIQYFLEALCLLILGFSYIVKGIHYPEIKGYTSIKTTTEQTYSSESASYNAQSPYRRTYPESSVFDEKPIIIESENTKKFCANCGTVLAEDVEFCSSCGMATK